MARKAGGKTGRGKTDAEAAKDMMFGNAMERDMERYSREAENPRRIDEDWKNHLRYDGNRNLITGGDSEFADSIAPGTDASFVDKMYMPYLGAGSSAERSAMNTKVDKTSEFSAEIGPGLRNRSGKRKKESKPSDDNKRR